MDINLAHFKVKGVAEVFDARRVYKDFRHWLIKEGYAPGAANQFPEVYFWQEETMKLGKTFWIWWRPSKKVGVFSGGMKKYVSRVMKINLHFLKLKDQEIMHQGKKMTVQKGTIEIFVHMILRFELGDWEKTPGFKKNMFELFWKRIYAKTLEGHKKEALGDAYKVQAYLKRILKMEVWVGEREPFFSAFGIADSEF